MTGLLFELEEPEPASPTDTSPHIYGEACKRCVIWNDEPWLIHGNGDDGRVNLTDGDRIEYGVPVNELTRRDGSKVIWRAACESS